VNARRIRYPPNQSIKSINFSHQMTLANATNTGIAGQFANGIEALSDQGSFGAHASGGGRRIATRVAAANDNYVKDCITTCCC
jgi:hypothetical protein